MENWKQIYELFKKSDLLNEMDFQFIKITEKMLASKKPICKKIVYSELWMSNWIKTTKCRIFIQQKLTF